MEPQMSVFIMFASVGIERGRDYSNAARKPAVSARLPEKYIGLRED